MQNPKIKSGLRFYPTPDGAYHVYDPGASRHFKLGEQEVSWLRMLDGRSSVQELVGKIPLEYFEDFFRNLSRMGLLEGSEAAKEPFNPFKIKVFKFDPSPLLESAGMFATGYRKFLNGVTWPLVFFNFFLLSGVVAGVPNLVPPVQQVVGNFHFSWVMILYYLLAVGIIAAIHELSHGLVATSYKVTVPAFGFMLLILNPAFYADVSGINHLADKDQRVQVLAAGVKSNNMMFFVGSIAYLFQSNTAAAPFWLFFIFLNLALAFVNLIPFVPYDGYYIFQELMGEPRYSARAISATLSRQSPRLDQVVYATLSLLLRFALVFLLINRLRLAAHRSWSSPYVDVIAAILFAAVWIGVARRGLRNAAAGRA